MKIMSHQSSKASFYKHPGSPYLATIGKFDEIVKIGDCTRLQVYRSDMCFVGCGPMTSKFRSDCNFGWEQLIRISEPSPFAVGILCYHLGPYSQVWHYQARAEIQRKAAQWARGEYGIVSVTRLLRDLGWADLADRRRNQRIILLYKILHNLLAVPPDSINIQRATRPARDSKNQLNLQRPRASDKSSPLWHCSIFRTIPDWNNLPTALAETDSLSVFKSRLAAPKP